MAISLYDYQQQAIAYSYLIDSPYFTLDEKKAMLIEQRLILDEWALALEDASFD